MGRGESASAGYPAAVSQAAYEEFFCPDKENYPLQCYLGGGGCLYIFLHFGEDQTGAQFFRSLSRFPSSTGVSTNKILPESILTGDCSCPVPNRAGRETLYLPRRQTEARPPAAPKDTRNGPGGRGSRRRRPRQSPAELGGGRGHRAPAALPGPPPHSPAGDFGGPSVGRTGRFCPRPLFREDLPWSERAQLQAEP